MATISREQYCGMNFHYFRHSFDRFLDDMVELEVRNVELWAAMPHFCVQDETLDGARAIRRKIAIRDLSLVCLTPEQCVYPINIASEQPATRDRSLNYFLRCIDFCTEMDCRKLLVTPGWGYVDAPVEDAWNRSRDGLRILARRAEQAGVELLLEPLTPTESNLITTADELKRMLDELGSPAVSAILDTNALAVVDDTIAGYAALGGGLSHVHLVDGSPDGHLAWGDGNLPLERYLRELADVGYQGALTFEFTTPRYWLDPLTPMRQSIEACDRAIGAMAGAVSARRPQAHGVA